MKNIGVMSLEQICSITSSMDTDLKEWLTASALQRGLLKAMQEEQDINLGKL